MNLLLSCKRILIPFAVFAFAVGLVAADNKAPGKKADNYPLKTCIVSDEALGSMGDYVTYVHKEAGKPDRAIRLCCEGCIDDFKAEPAKFLAKLDAAGKKSAPAKKSKAGGDKSQN